MKTVEIGGARSVCLGIEAVKPPKIVMVHPYLDEIPPRSHSPVRRMMFQFAERLAPDLGLLFRWNARKPPVEQGLKGRYWGVMESPLARGIVDRSFSVIPGRMRTRLFGPCSAENQLFAKAVVKVCEAWRPKVLAVIDTGSIVTFFSSGARFIRA